MIVTSPNPKIVRAGPLGGPLEVLFWGLNLYHRVAFAPAIDKPTVARIGGRWRHRSSSAGRAFAVAAAVSD
jgi:hypothetical protein